MRPLDIVILSDLHLGTTGCKAEELLSYLNGIDPKLIILNGDIIDGWNFRKKYFPKAHILVIQKILKFIEKGTKVIYITGNHDDMLRRYADLRIHNFFLTNKYIFSVGKKTYWVFHGDVFDRTTKGYAKIIAKLGGKGYDLLIVMNRYLNAILTFFGAEKRSFSKMVKSRVKEAVKWINNFEKTAIELGIDQGYDYVVCGHIHQPKIEKVTTSEGSIIYMNSGDWVEHGTALEYQNDQWTIYEFDGETSTDKPASSTINSNDLPLSSIIKGDIYKYHIESLKP